LEVCSINVDFVKHFLDEYVALTQQSAFVSYLLCLTLYCEAVLAYARGVAFA
jgi:hypothetical protein